MSTRKTKYMGAPERSPPLLCKMMRESSQSYRTAKIRKKTPQAPKWDGEV